MFSKTLHLNNNIIIEEKKKQKLLLVKFTQQCYLPKTTRIGIYKRETTERQ